MSKTPNTPATYTSGLISLLLPTRGRAKLVDRFLGSVLKHTTHLDQVEIILYIDNDDTDSHHICHSNIKIHKIIGPKETMGSYNSKCLKKATGEIIILVNDDMVIQTKKWDEAIRSVHSRFSDSIYLAYPNDLFKRRKLCTFPILSRHTCNLLKEPYPLAYRSAFIDVHIFDIFKRLKHAGHDRICYLEDVIFEHKHYRNGKAPLDETYRQKDRFADDATFLNLRGMRHISAYRLQQAIQGTETQYHPLPNNFIEPSNPVSALVKYTQYILFDSGLPIRWRTWLWFWFYGRFLAAKDWLKPFVS